MVAIDRRRGVSIVVAVSLSSQVGDRSGLRSVVPTLAAWLTALLVWLYYLTPAFVWPAGRSWQPFLVMAGTGLLAIAGLQLRRRAPLLVVLLVSICLVVSPAGVGAGFVVQASLAARRSRPALILVSAVLLTAATVARLTRGPYNTDGWTQASVVEFSFALIGVGLATATGRLWGWLSADDDAVRRDAAAAREAADRARMEQVRLSERERIAREMHDVVAHRISLIAMHSAALAHRDDLDQRTTRDTAALIQQNAKDALGELRVMLSQLRGERAAPEPPQPTLQELPVLVAEAREGGQRISLTQQGPIVELPTRVSRSAYRIVQEGLTNARKHAPGAPVSIEVRAEDGRLTVTVINSLSELALPAADGSGMGLVGIRERVTLLGGTMSAAADGRDWRLTATIPLSAGMSGHDHPDAVIERTP